MKKSFLSLLALVVCALTINESYGSEVYKAPAWNWKPTNAKGASVTVPNEGLSTSDHYKVENVDDQRDVASDGQSDSEQLNDDGTTIQNTNQENKNTIVPANSTTTRSTQQKTVPNARKPSSVIIQKPLTDDKKVEYWNTKEN